jgi:hypothetical protein
MHILSTNNAKLCTHYIAVLTETFSKFVFFNESQNSLYINQNHLRHIVKCNYYRVRNIHWRQFGVNKKLNKISVKEYTKHSLKPTNSQAK